MSRSSPFRHDDPPGSAGVDDQSAAPPNGSAGTNGSINGSAASGQLSRVDALEYRVRRLSLVCEAMWELLSQEVGLGLDQLADRVDDLAAGIESRTDEPQPGVCPDCGQAMPPDARVCLFCSARAPGQDLYG